MNTTSSARKVLFLGTHGQFNVGDELLLETFLTQLGRQHRYRVNSYAPDETAAQLGPRFQVEVFDTASDRRGLLSHIRSSDVVIFGGGSIVKELYGSVGRWRYATLCMVLAVVVFARVVARRPVLLSNIGVGPITTPMGRALAGLIVRSASLVSVRDAESLALCRRLVGDSPRVTLVPDAVWANEAASFGPFPGPPAGGRMRVALSLNRDIENGANWEPFLDQLATALRLVAAEIEIELHALPMQVRFKEHNDYAVIEGFFERLGDDVPTVLHKPVDHGEVAAIISSCDLVVAERLHAVVLAAILERPVVVLAYDVKVRALAHQLGLADRAVDVNAPFDPAHLARQIVDTAASREAEAQRLAALAELFRHDLDRYFHQVRDWMSSPRTVAGWPAPHAVSEPARR